MIEIDASPAPPAPPVARILGWISLAMGLTLLAPGRAARLFGLGRRPGLMAVIGVRDVAIGLGLLRGRRPAVWLRAQAAADAVDATIVGLELLRRSGPSGSPGLSGPSGHPGGRIDRWRRWRRLAWLGLAIGSAVVALRSAGHGEFDRGRPVTAGACWRGQHRSGRR